MLFRTIKPYLVALVAVAAATALRVALIPILGPHTVPFITYFAAIFAAAWFGGTWAGIAAGVLSIAAAQFFIVMRGVPSFPTPAAAATALAVFVLDIALIFYINSAYRRVTDEQKDHESQIKLQLHAMELLNSVGQRCLTAGNDIEGVLGEVVEAAIMLSGAARGNVQLFEPSSGGLKLVAHRGFEKPFLSFFDLVTTQGSICELAMKSRGRAIVSDVAGSEVLTGTAARQVILDAGVRALQATPLISSSGNLLGMISTHFDKPTEPTEQQLAVLDLLARQTADFLERKQAERALQASELQLRQFLNAVPTGIARCSRELHYLAANPAYAAILGVTVDEIAGRPIIDVLGPERWQVIRPAVERALNGERVEYESEVLSERAGRRFFHIVYTPERDERGAVIGWISSVNDLTVFREAKENLAKLEKLAAAGQLAATLAHEINNPLNAVINCVYLLQTGTVDDATRKILVDSASTELTRMGRIVNQSLSYYRTGMAEQDVDLAALVRDSLQIFARKLENGGIQVREKVETVPPILGFPNELRQVFDNLLLNAIEAMPKGGVLSVAVRPARLWNSGMSGVRVTVADKGSGMSAEILDRVFEPFFTTKAEKGTGLGLWVVKGILAKHGAAIQVRSHAGPQRTGTVISFVFPAPAVQRQRPVPSKDLVAS